MTRAFLRLLDQEGRYQLDLELNNDQHLIGRNSKMCDLYVPCTYVSRQHGRFDWDPAKGTYRFTSLGKSANTWVNNEQVAERMLLNGDVLRLGTFQGAFKLANVEAAPGGLHSEATNEMQEAPTRAQPNPITSKDDNPARRLRQKGQSSDVAAAVPHSPTIEPSTPKPSVAAASSAKDSNLSDRHAEAEEATIMSLDDALAVDPMKQPVQIDSPSETPTEAVDYKEGIRRETGQQIVVDDEPEAESTARSDADQESFESNETMLAMEASGVEESEESDPFAETYDDVEDAAEAEQQAEPADEDEENRPTISAEPEEVPDFLVDPRDKDAPISDQPDDPNQSVSESANQVRLGTKQQPAHDDDASASANQDDEGRKQLENILQASSTDSSPRLSIETYFDSLRFETEEVRFKQEKPSSDANEAELTEEEFLAGRLNKYRDTELAHEAEAMWNRSAASSINRGEILGKLEEYFQAELGDRYSDVADQNRVVDLLLTEGAGFGTIQRFLTNPDIHEIFLMSPEKLMIGRSDARQREVLKGSHFIDPDSIPQIIDRVRRFSVRSIKDLDGHDITGRLDASWVYQAKLDDDPLACHLRLVRVPLNIPQKQLPVFLQLEQEQVDFLMTSIESGKRVLLCGNDSPGLSVLINYLMSRLPEHFVTHLSDPTGYLHHPQSITPTVEESEALQSQMQAGPMADQALDLLRLCSLKAGEATAMKSNLHHPDVLVELHRQTPWSWRVDQLYHLPASSNDAEPTLVPLEI
jgi:pSer/pThr/pTyr-binding forkhead associated (FHA) protein